MKPFSLLLLVFSILMVVSCGNTKKINENQSNRYFLMGSGGGFTSVYTTYRIHSSGKVEMSKSALKGYSFFKNLPTDSVKKMFSDLDALSLASYNFNSPGNITYFLVVDGHMVKWGAATKPVRNDISIFFEQARKFLKAN
jgi:hypothetical protein